MATRTPGLLQARKKDRPKKDSFKILQMSDLRILSFNTKKIMSENKKRPVEFISEVKLKTHDQRANLPRSKWYDKTKKTGIFLQWGMEVHDCENEVATQSIGIIEDETGQVHSVVPERIKFLDKQ